MKRPEEFKASNPRKCGISGSEVTASIAAFVAQCVQNHGVEKGMADEIALNVMRDFRAMYGGHNIYIPMEKREEISERDREICGRFIRNELSIGDIAHEYGISLQWAYKIIHNMRTKMRAEQNQQRIDEREANHQRWKRENL